MNGNLSRGLQVRTSSAYARLGTMKRAERSTRRALHNHAFQAGQQAQATQPRLVVPARAWTVHSLDQFLRSTPVIDPVSVTLDPVASSTLDKVAAIGAAL